LLIFLLQLDRLSEAESPAREVSELASTRWHSEAGLCLVVRSEILARLGAPDAEESLSDAEHLIDELEQEVVRPQLLRAKGLLLLARGDLSRAIAMLEESAMLARTQYARIELGRTLAVLAEAAGQRGDQALLARVAEERVAVTDAIGPEVLGLPWSGGGLTARGTRRQVRLGDGETRPLTAREREVAELIALGLTDRQIAERLVITEGTAGVHVTHMMNKLGLHTRIEIASWVVQGGLPDAREVVR
jgi:DNA-binding CsgD family transcriptional regulator